VKSLFTKYISPVLAQATLTMGALLLSACGASVTEVANLPNGGTVTAVVSPSRVVAGQIYTYEAKSSSGSTVTWSWGDGSPDTVGSTVKKVWNKSGSQTVTLSAKVGGNTASVTRSVTVSGEPVSAGSRHTCALQASGTVLCWGYNSDGELGNGTIGGGVTATVLVTGLTDAVALSAGGLHTCAIKAGGSVVCWGNGGTGQLGDGRGVNSTTPVTVSGLADAVAISAGDSHTCALKADGSVACWGNNGNGKLGDGTITSSSTTVAVTGLTDAVAISAGKEHNCAIKVDRTVVCWGGGIGGQLGNGTSGSYRTVTVVVTGLTDAVAVNGGWEHTCALKSNGSAVCWGNNLNGELGDGTTVTRTISTAVIGMTDAVAISAGGNGAGFNNDHRGRTCALKANGSTVCWGDKSYAISGSGLVQATPTVVAGLTDTAALSMGSGHTCALKTSGAIVCWGDDRFAQIGDGSTGSIPTRLVAVSASDGAAGLLTDAAQVSAGISHSCILKNNGSVVCWGGNFSGALGNPSLGGASSYPTATSVVGFTDTVTKLTVGFSRTCALLSTNRSVACWGYNPISQTTGGGSQGGLAQPTPTAVVGLTDTVAQLSMGAGGFHTCAILTTNRNVVCWGTNFFGQRGNGVTQTLAPLTPTAVIGLTDAVTQLSLGDNHTCALQSNGSVLCWGRNENGQLGDSGLTASSQATPTSVVGLNGTDTVQISAGSNHTCALKSNGSVLCWGSNLLGQLGNPSVAIGTQTNPTPVAVVNLGTDTVQITAGGNFTCALKSNGNVLCWGGNQLGELGDPNVIVTNQTTPIPVIGLSGTDTLEINAGAAHTCAVKSNGSVLCWGGIQMLGNTIDASIKPAPVTVLGGTIFWR
jgi:alpha-tubulin suppressor-like RCC1 family protein